MTYLKKTVFSLMVVGMLAFGFGQLAMASYGYVDCNDLYYCDLCPDGPGAGPVPGGYIYYVHDCAFGQPPATNCFEAN